DGPIAALAERLGRAAEQQHLSKITISGAPLDLVRSAGTILVVHEHGRLEPRLLAGPFRSLPVVHRAAVSMREFAILQALAAAQRVEDPERDVIGIEVVPAHELEIAAGLAA